MKKYRYNKEESQRLMSEICDYIISMHQTGNSLIVSEICHHFSISTSNFYYWLNMYVKVSSPDKYEEVRTILSQSKSGMKKKQTTEKEKALLQIYKLCTTEELNPKEIQEFCKRNKITLKEFMLYYKIYLENYATEEQYEIAQRAHYLRKYEKIIFSILKEENIEKKKTLLMKHRELYSLKAHVFVSKHPDYAGKIKQLTILYQQAITENQHRVSTILTKIKNKEK